MQCFPFSVVVYWRKKQKKVTSVLNCPLLPPSGARTNDIALKACSSSLCRLSGESPFQGDNDVETLALVTAAQWEFDEESFEEITQEAKDFISSLIIKESR